MTRNLLALFLIAFSFAIGLNAWAHEPRYIQDDQLVVIKNPDVSQAFYGELKGQDAYYLIDLKKEQELYFQILVPDLPGIKKDKTVSVEYLPDFGSKTVDFLKLDPAAAAWPSFYEEYAGDNYLEGPAGKKSGQAGYYVIKVASLDNAGKYVLVVGQKEEFPAGEAVKALITIPQLKTRFFNKPIWQSFEGRIGKYFAISLVILLVLGFMFHKFRQVYK